MNIDFRQRLFNGENKTKIIRRSLVDTVSQQLKKILCSLVCTLHRPTLVDTDGQTKRQKSGKHITKQPFFIRNRGGGYKVIYGIIRLSKLINVDAYKRSKVSVNENPLIFAVIKFPAF